MAVFGVLAQEGEEAMTPADLAKMFGEVDEALADAIEEWIGGARLVQTRLTLRKIAEAWPNDFEGDGGYVESDTRRAILEVLK